MYKNVRYISVNLCKVMLEFILRKENVDYI